MINKNRYKITNNKKLLHKVGKHWVVMSAFVLALLGAGTVSTTSIHASNIQPNPIITQTPKSANTNSPITSIHSGNNSTSASSTNQINHKATNVYTTLHSNYQPVVNQKQPISTSEVKNQGNQQQSVASPTTNSNNDSVSNTANQNRKLSVSLGNPEPQNENTNYSNNKNLSKIYIQLGQMSNHNFVPIKASQPSYNVSSAHVLDNGLISDEGKIGTQDDIKSDAMFLNKLVTPFIPKQFSYNTHGTFLNHFSIVNSKSLGNLFVSDGIGDDSLTFANQPYTVQIVLDSKPTHSSKKSKTARNYINYTYNGKILKRVYRSKRKSRKTIDANISTIMSDWLSDTNAGNSKSDVSDLDWDMNSALRVPSDYTISDNTINKYRNLFNSKKDSQNTYGSIQYNIPLTYNLGQINVEFVEKQPNGQEKVLTPSANSDKSDSSLVIQNNIVHDIGAVGQPHDKSGITYDFDTILSPLMPKGYTVATQLHGVGLHGQYDLLHAILNNPKLQGVHLENDGINDETLEFMPMNNSPLIKIGIVPIQATGKSNITINYYHTSDNDKFMKSNSYTDKIGNKFDSNKNIKVPYGYTLAKQLNNLPISFNNENQTVNVYLKRKIMSTTINYVNTYNPSQILGHVTYSGKYNDSDYKASDLFSDMENDYDKANDNHTIPDYHNLSDIPNGYTINNHDYNQVVNDVNGIDSSIMNFNNNSFNIPVNKTIAVKFVDSNTHNLINQIEAPESFYVDTTPEFIPQSYHYQSISYDKPNNILTVFISNKSNAPVPNKPTHKNSGSASTASKNNIPAKPVIPITPTSASAVQPSNVSPSTSNASMTPKNSSMSSSSIVSNTNRSNSNKSHITSASSANRHHRKSIIIKHHKASAKSNMISKVSHSNHSTSYSKVNTSIESHLNNSTRNSMENISFSHASNENYGNNNIRNYNNYVLPYINNHVAVYNHKVINHNNNMHKLPQTNEATVNTVMIACLLLLLSGILISFSRGFTRKYNK